MEIFWRLLLAHLIADFTLQTNLVNRMKRTSVFGMSIHVGTHIVVSALLVYTDLSRQWFSVLGWPIAGWMALGAMSVGHFAIDELRVYLIRDLKYPDDTLSFIVDQVAHFVCVFLFSPVEVFKNPLLVQEKWVVIISCLVMVSHVTTILIYFVEKDRGWAQFPSFDQKYFLIMERVVMWAFFLAAGYWWIPFLLVWIFQMFYIQKKRVIDVSNANLLISIFSAAIFGLISRYVYYGRI